MVEEMEEEKEGKRRSGHPKGLRETSDVQDEG